jgi:hypothetical protein
LDLACDLLFAVDLEGLDLTDVFFTFLPFTTVLFCFFGLTLLPLELEVVGTKIARV